MDSQARPTDRKKEKKFTKQTIKKQKMQKETKKE